MAGLCVDFGIYGVQGESWRHGDFSSLARSKFYKFFRARKIHKFFDIF